MLYLTYFSVNTQKTPPEAGRRCVLKLTESQFSPSFSSRLYLFSMDTFSL